MPDKRVSSRNFNNYKGRIGFLIIDISENLVRLSQLYFLIIQIIDFYYSSMIFLYTLAPPPSIIRIKS